MPNLPHARGHLSQVEVRTKAAFNPEAIDGTLHRLEVQEPIASEGGGPGGSGTIRAVSILPVEGGEPCREELLPAMADAPEGIGPAPGGARRSRIATGLGVDDLRTLMETIGDEPIVCHRAAREVRPLLQAAARAGLPFHPVVISAAKLGHLLLGLKAGHATIDLATALGLDAPEPDDSRGRVRLLARCFLELIPILQESGVDTIEELQEFQNQPAAPLDLSGYAFSADDLRGIPSVPGVYCFMDRQEATIYIGKAKNLRSRVASYFTPSARGTPRGAAILDQVHTFSFARTASELEAILTEAALLSEMRPRLNRQFEVHERPAPYGPRLNLAVVLPNSGSSPGATAAGCTVHLLRGGRFITRIGPLAPATGSAGHSTPWRRLERSVRAVYFEDPIDAGSALDWNLISSYLRRHRDGVNILDMDECESPQGALARLRVLAGAAAAGERVVTR